MVLQAPLVAVVVVVVVALQGAAPMAVAAVGAVAGDVASSSEQGLPTHLTLLVRL
jgi:hypothetical protein